MRWEKMPLEIALVGPRADGRPGSEIKPVTLCTIWDSPTEFFLRDTAGFSVPLCWCLAGVT
jgi:hypothetical protein